MKQSIRNSKLKNSKNLKYEILEMLFDNSSDPDLHFYNTNIQNLNTPYILHEELQNLQGNDKDESISVLHLNTRSINKNFENLNKCFYRM